MLIFIKSVHSGGRPPIDRRSVSRRSRSRDRRSVRRSPERRPLPSRPKEKPVGRVPPSRKLPQPSSTSSESSKSKPKESEKSDKDKEDNKYEYLPAQKSIINNVSRREQSTSREPVKKYSYVSSTPCELYYKYVKGVFQPTQRQVELCNDFEKHLVQRGKDARAAKPAYAPLQRKQKLHVHKCTEF